jgi:phosphomannomutase/phosphoglucomutase
LGLLRKNADSVTAKPRPSGRPLLVYFLPGLLVAIGLVLLVTFLARQLASSAADQAAHESASQVAAALAGRLEGEILARRQLMLLALADGRVADAVRSGQKAQLSEVVDDLQKRIPGLLQLRVLSPDVTQPDVGGPAPMGYAGLDMLRQVARGGQPSMAEIHQIKSGAPYLALAIPVAAEGHSVAVAFAAWDMRPVIAVIESAAGFPGKLALVQGDDAGYVLAERSGAAAADAAAGTVDVPESIWKLRFSAASTDGAFAGIGGLLIAVGGGSLALLLVVLLEWRMVSGALRKDMTTLVTLGESIRDRANTPPAQAELAVSHDAIALLSQFVRDGRGGNGSASAAKDTSTRKAVGTPVAAESHGLDGLEVEELAPDDDALPVATAPAAQTQVVDVPESLFRAYDIRGVVGEALTEDLAELLGRAVGSLVIDEGGSQVVVARDARLSSPALAGALIDGIAAAGCGVIDLGQVPTPLLYFAIQTEPVHGGVMVTGSHNPAEYNGFKIVVGDRVLDGDELKALRERMISGPLREGRGQIEQVSLQDSYVEAVGQSVQLTRPLKVVLDAGNGVAGELALATLEALGCEVVPLFCEPDGSFPNHHPDPGNPENLAALLLEVQAQQADVGLAFDGDGDRLGVVDDTGQLVWADQVLMLLAADVLGRHPGVDVLYDVKSSRHLASFILSHGGRPIMWKSGHSRMRSKMLETGALLGGEFSGHLFIKERWYGFDDAIYAAARVLEILALESTQASELFGRLPSSPSTPEYQLLLAEGQSREIMRALDAHKVFDDARLVELDGLRVEFANGWGLIRASNTVPSLTFRFEADDEQALEQIKAQFRDLLRRVAPDMQAPF